MNTQSLDLFKGQSLNDLGSSVDSILMFVTIGSVILTVVILVFWITSYLHRRKVEQAIIEIRDILKDMNQRDNTPTPRLATTLNNAPSIPSSTIQAPSTDQPPTTLS